MGHQFRSPATLEDVQDGQDSHSGFVEAAGLAATAAVRGHTHQSAPRHQPGGLGGAAVRWGKGHLEASHDHSHCSEGTVQQDNQDPENRGRTHMLHFFKMFNFLRCGSNSDLKNKIKQIVFITCNTSLYIAIIL